MTPRRFLLHAAPSSRRHTYAARMMLVALMLACAALASASLTPTKGNSGVDAAMAMRSVALQQRQLMAYRSLDAVTDDLSSTASDEISSTAEPEPIPPPPPAVDTASSSSGAAGGGDAPAVDASSSSSAGSAPVVPADVRPSEDDTTSILTTVFTVVGVLIAVICLERLYSSCRRTYRRRQGTEGFSQLAQPDGANSFNPDLTGEELELRNMRDGDDHL